MEHVWKEYITMDALFATIQKIKFNEKQQNMIQDLVDNAFFYEDKENPTSSSNTTHLLCIEKNKKKSVQLSKDEVRRALSTVF